MDVELISTCIHASSSMHAHRSFDRGAAFAQNLSGLFHKPRCFTFNISVSFKIRYLHFKTTWTNQPLTSRIGNLRFSSVLKTPTGVGKPAQSAALSAFKLDLRSIVSYVLPTWCNASRFRFPRYLIQSTTASSINATLLLQEQEQEPKAPENRQWKAHSFCILILRKYTPIAIAINCNNPSAKKALQSKRRSFIHSPIHSPHRQSAKSSVVRAATGQLTPTGADGPLLSWHFSAQLCRLSKTTFCWSRSGANCILSVLCSIRVCLLLAHLLRRPSLNITPFLSSFLGNLLLLLWAKLKKLKLYLSGKTFCDFL